jgi:hypothetical protein
MIYGVMELSAAFQACKFQATKLIFNNYIFKKEIGLLFVHPSRIP